MASPSRRCPPPNGARSGSPNPNGRQPRSKPTTSYGGQGHESRGFLYAGQSCPDMSCGQASPERPCREDGRDGRSLEEAWQDCP
jgi:hypothetical protein